MYKKGCLRKTLENTRKKNLTSHHKTSLHVRERATFCSISDRYYGIQTFHYYNIINNNNYNNINISLFFLFHFSPMRYSFIHSVSRSFSKVGYRSFPTDQLLYHQPVLYNLERPTIVEEGISTAPTRERGEKKEKKRGQTHQSPDSPGNPELAYPTHVHYIRDPRQSRRRTSHQSRAQSSTCCSRHCRDRWTSRRP